MVASIDEGAEAPPVLRLSWMAKKYGSLPDVGGVLDQEFSLMHQMGVASNVYDTVSRLRGLKGEQIHSLSISERRLIKALQEMDLI